MTSTDNSAAVAAAEAVQGFGGFLRCEVCGATRDLGNTSTYLSTGWPTHHGYAMRWWTQRQIDSGEMPPEPAGRG